MVVFSEKDLKAIADIAALSGGNADFETVRETTVELVHSVFRSDSTIFWLTDEHNMLVDPILKNIQTQYLGRYKSHFYRQNPFDPTNFELDSGPSVVMEQLISLPDFHKTEYYNDFIRPQNIRRQMAVYIQNKGKLTAVLGLHRSNEKAFEKKNRVMGNLVAGYLSAAFDHLDVMKQIHEKGNFYQMICDHASLGIVILNSSKQEIFRNHRAKQIFRRFLPEFGSGVSVKQNLGYLLPLIQEDCQWIDSMMGQKCEIPLVMKKERIVEITPGERYRVQTELLQMALSGSRSPIYMITLEEAGGIAPIGEATLKQNFGLTKRESEIAGYILKGFRNNEIAGALSITEGTVKNHLKHIFEKTRVTSRTELIHRIIC